MPIESKNRQIQITPRIASSKYMPGKTTEHGTGGPVHGATIPWNDRARVATAIASRHCSRSDRFRVNRIRRASTIRDTLVPDGRYSPRRAWIGSTRAARDAG